ncbi:hypothetical protein BsWGS_19511 [Bradybaena similaris]
MPATQMEQKVVPVEELNSDRESSSAPQSRSNSWRYKHRSSIRREKRLSYMARANSASMPDCSDSASFKKASSSEKECPLCMVRSFKTTPKGIVESGSFSKSLSSNSLLSSGSLNTSHGSSSSSSSSSSSNYTNNSSSRSASVDRDRAGSVGSSEGSDRAPSISISPSYFRTLVLGAPGVGKTSLVQQLTRSDSQNDEEEHRISESGPIVSVELDGHESTMEFIDGADLSDLECYRADAFVLMYAVSEPESFTFAVNLLNYLRHDLGTDRTIFLVANKTDLVRQRLVISHDAIKYTSTNDCHFIETSMALNVNLDELLIGILCNIKKQLIPADGLENQENRHRLKRCNSERRSGSSGRALSAISNFIKHACRREDKKRRAATVKLSV